MKIKEIKLLAQKNQVKRVFEAQFETRYKRYNINKVLKILLRYILRTN